MIEVMGDVSGLAEPALVVAFQDWVDAGAAASTAARHIASGGELVARFDGDALFDFRSHRPVLDIVDGNYKELQLPELTIVRNRFDGRDVLVMTGPEPDYRWNEFGRSVLEIAQQAGIVRHISLGAIPSAVPHTAPTPVMTTASSDDLLTDKNVATEGLLRVPAAAVSLVEWTLSNNGVGAVGFWAQVPHYLSPYPPGAIALVRRVEDHLGVVIGVGEMEAEAAALSARLDEMFSSRPEAKEYLEQLEQLAGQPEVPGADEIAAEVERFLRSQPGEGGT
ncbi:MAG: PAC2 family protein [Actinomycetota bacterium]